jgi:acyl carrier protein
MSSVPAEVEAFILKELALGGAVESIAPDEDLLATGIIDSHGFMELIAFLDQQYGIVVPEDELKPENFQSLDAIDAFVQRSRR